MYKPHGITCKIMYFHDVISQSIRQGVTKKSGVSLFLLPEGGVVEDRGGRKNDVCSYFIVNDRVMYSPTTSPYGYSSFPKEENEDTTDFLATPHLRYY